MLSDWNCPVCGAKMVRHCAKIPTKRWAVTCRMLECEGCNLLRSVVNGRTCVNRERKVREV